MTVRIGSRINMKGHEEKAMQGHESMFNSGQLYLYMKNFNQFLN